MKTITTDQLQCDCVSSIKREIRRVFTHPCRWSVSAEIQKKGGGAMSLDNTNSDTGPSHVTIDSTPARLGVQPLELV